MTDDISRAHLRRDTLKIAALLGIMESRIRGVTSTAQELEKNISGILDRLEKILGPSEAITRYREILKATMQIYADDATIPALDAAKEAFGDLAEDLARMVGEIPDPEATE